MKQGLVSVLLALGMVLALLPGTALAAHYGDALKDSAQTVYQALEKSRQAAERDGIAVTGTITESGTYVQLNARAEELENAAEVGAYLFNYDHPELFWLKTEIRMTGEAAGYPTAATMDVQLTMPVSASWLNGRSIAGDKAAMAKVVDEIVKEAQKKSSAAEQLRYVHNWLTSHNAYNRAAVATRNYINTDSTPWSAFSALDAKLSPVCEGYARAFKVICDKLDIDCVLVGGKANGGEHMWNYVQLDGKWYAVDVTYDDPVINGKDTDGTEDYFLVGGNTKIDGKTFKASHVPDTELGSYCPPLNDDKY